MEPPGERTSSSLSKIVNYEDFLYFFLIFFSGQALEMQDLTLKVKSRPVELNFNARNGIGISLVIPGT